MLTAEQLTKMNLFWNSYYMTSETQAQALHDLKELLWHIRVLETLCQKKEFHFTWYEIEQLENQLIEQDNKQKETLGKQFEELTMREGIPHSTKNGVTCSPMFRWDKDRPPFHPDTIIKNES